MFDEAFHLLPLSSCCGAKCFRHNVRAQIRTWHVGQLDVPTRNVVLDEVETVPNVAHTI